MKIEIYEVYTPDDKYEYCGSRFIISHNGLSLIPNYDYPSANYAWRWARHYANKHFPGVKTPTKPICITETTNYEFLL